jgi:hypothetical protein
LKRHLVVGKKWCAGPVYPIPAIHTFVKRHTFALTFEAKPTAALADGGFEQASEEEARALTAPQEVPTPKLVISVTLLECSQFEE